MPDTRRDHHTIVPSPNRADSTYLTNTRECCRKASQQSRLLQSTQCMLRRATAFPADYAVAIPKPRTLTPYSDHALCKMSAYTLPSFYTQREERSCSGCVPPQTVVSPLTRKPCNDAPREETAPAEVAFSDSAVAAPLALAARGGVRLLVHFLFFFFIFDHQPAAPPLGSHLRLRPTPPPGRTWRSSKLLRVAIL